VNEKNGYPAHGKIGLLFFSDVAMDAAFWHGMLLKAAIQLCKIAACVVEETIMKEAACAHLEHTHWGNIFCEV